MPWPWSSTVPEHRFNARVSLKQRFAAIFLLLALLCPVSALAALPQADTATLLLAVEVNGRDTGLIVETHQKQGQAAVTPDDLHALGLRCPDCKGSDPVPLASLHGVREHIDQHRQVLVLQVDDDALIATRLGAAAPNTATPVAVSGWGGVMNYNLLGTQVTGGKGAGQTTQLNGLFDAHAYSPYGILSSGFLGQTEMGQHAIRLDSNYVFTDEAGMRRWTVGDTISGGLNWTRPLRLGGLQMSSDFSVRPDLVTYPLPQITGRTGVPSTVDVLVNGVRQLSQDVQSGPFELRQPPIVTGAGDVAVVVRDALGQETVQNLAFYASPQLLKPGLASYSVETGYTRDGYGRVSDDYRQPAAIGTLRAGVLPWLTSETHAEASDHVVMAGQGAAIDMFGYGTLSVAMAGSTSFAGWTRDGTMMRNGSGLQYSVGFEHIGRWYSISLARIQRMGRFADVSTATGDPVPLSTTRAGFGLNFGDWGSLHAAYVDVNRGLLSQTTSAANNYNRATLVVGDARIVTATYSRPINEKITFYATGYRDFAQSGNSGINLGISVALGSRTSASGSGAITGGRPAAYLDAAQAAVTPGDWGWHVGASQDQNPQQVAETSYIAQSASVNGGIGHLQSGNSNSFTGRAGVQGALVVARDSVFATNRVGDSFAVVDTNGVAGVPVLQENRPVGKTDSDGLLLVPGLRGWEQNRLAIDPAGLPADLVVTKTQDMVRPQGKSGVSVGFGIQRDDSAIVQLVDGSGKPLPPGSMATLRRSGAVTPVGYDGETFLHGLHGAEDLDVQSTTTKCTAHIDYVAKSGEIPRYDKVPCQKVAPP